MARATLSPILKTLSGTLGNLVVRNRNGQTVYALRPTRRKAGRTSSEEMRARNVFGQAVRGWRTLTLEEKDSWRAYARRFFRNCPERPGAPSGYNVFAGAACLNQAAGREIARSAPPTAPPEAVHSLRVAPFENTRTLQFEVEHWLGNPDGHVLYLQITPPDPHGCMLLKRRLRAIQGNGPASYPALTSSPQTLRFENLKREYPPESQFLVRAVIANAAGVASVPFIATAAFGEEAWQRPK